jgi:hypothetical protein
MLKDKARHDTGRRIAVATALLGGLFCAALAPAQTTPAARPDAVIELWEQHWTLNADGSTVYHFKQHVQLNDERAYGEFGDPRITFDEQSEKLEIVAARTKLADGRYQELADYSKVVVGPDGATGWPAFGSLRQQLLVMGGLEPGCVVELEYKITAKPGRRAYLAADLRLDHRYSIRKRVVSVTVPKGVTVRSAVGHLPSGMAAPAPDQTQWAFDNLPAAIDEPQSPPWQVRSPRLMFSTAGDLNEWLSRRTAEIEAAADESEYITAIATEWTKDQKDPVGKLRALQEKLGARLNFVEFPVDWRPPGLRPASDVLANNYGLPAETAAALLALGRAAKLPVRAGMLVNDEVWNDDVPQDGAVAAYVVLFVNAPEANGEAAADIETVDIWEARQGRILRNGHWAGYALLPAPNQVMPLALLPPFAEPDESHCRVFGKVTVGDDGNFAGDLWLQTTGLFVTSEALRTSDAQKARLAALLGRVLPDLTIDSFVVKTLSSGEFEAAAKIKSAKPLKKFTDRQCLVLAADSPALADVPLPLAPVAREMPIRLTGAFDEEVGLTIEWPEKWEVEALPDALPAAKGDWGTTGQTVTREKNSVRLQRHVRVNNSTLLPPAFVALRDSLNELRSEHARALILRKVEKPETTTRPATK